MSGRSFFSGEEWADLSPIPMPEDDEACAQINYGPEFAETMGYFRAVLQKDERSERALKLTARVIEGNAANYTAWFYRRECLKALNEDLQAELDFATEAAFRSPKNYQIWYHRRAIIELLNDGSQELAFTAEVLADDSKNYHAWSHRQFALRHFNLWDGELEFIETLLEEDVRNNSAWNQRWFVIQNTTGFKDSSIRERELSFAWNLAKLAPNNESPFNYLRGILHLPDFKEEMLVRESMKTILNAVKEAPEDHPNSRHPPSLLGFCVDFFALVGEPTIAIQYCEDLASKYDMIRSKYWTYRKQRILKSVPEVPAQNPIPPISA